MLKLPMLALTALLPVLGAATASVAAADGPYGRYGGRPANRPLAFVPNLVGRSWAEAQALLASGSLVAALDPVSAGFVSDFRLPYLSVAAQNPAAGAALPEGTVVSLTLAAPAYAPGAGPFQRRDERGERWMRMRRQRWMPDLAGVPVAQARALLEERGVIVTLEERVAPEAALDVVLLQQPAAGTSLPRDAVALLSVARAVRVPQLLGRALSEARQLAARAGLALEVEDGFHRYAGFHGPRLDGPSRRASPWLQLERLQVIETQSRRAGERVAEGSTLRVQARLGALPLSVPPAHQPAPFPRGWNLPGPDPRVGPAPAPVPAPVPVPAPLLFVTVPDVVGSSLAEARAALEGLGLRVDVDDEREPGRGGGRPAETARVAAQDLGAGTRTTVGASVRLTLARRGR